MTDNVIRTITIRGSSEGLDKLTADIKKLAAAEQGLAVVSDDLTKSQLSLEQQLKRQNLKLDEAARAQANIDREIRLSERGVKQKLKTDEEHARTIELVNQRYAVAATATQKFTQQTGLARHELINLGRQAQDVGVSLASGQSPFMVLVQQGTQIADVFIASGKSIGSFFSQVIGWAGRFIGSVAGITTAVAGTTVAIGSMVSSFASAQREIDKVLSGTGAASGATRGGINRIAEGAAGGGMSTADARQAALAFAATGKIYEQNINTATNVTREFARAMGIDTADAAKQLAAALVDPSKGALDLNKQIGFLDATTLNYIRTLQSQGKLQEAQNVLLAAAAPAIGKQAGQVSVLTKAWDFATKALADFDEANAKAIARSLERMTGADLGGFELQEQLERARARQSQLQQSRTPGLSALQLRQATAEVERLEQKLADLAKATDDQRFNQLSVAADAFARAIIPSIENIEKLTQAINTMERAKEAGVASPNQDAALAVARMQLSIAIETVEVEQRKAQVFAANALAYQGVSALTAQTLAQLQSQLGIAQAITGAAQIEAQHRATIVQWLAQGKTLTDAIALADAQRAISLARVNAEADRTLKNLQQQGELLRASSEWDKARIAAAQKYNDLLEEGVDSLKAGQIAAQMQSNARATEDARDATVSWSVANDEAGAASRRLGTSVRRTALDMANMANAAEEAARGLHSLFGAFFHGLPSDTPYIEGKTAWNNFTTQFNPAGYQSSMNIYPGLDESQYELGPSGAPQPKQQYAAQQRAAGYARMDAKTQGDLYRASALEAGLGKPGEATDMLVEYFGRLASQADEMAKNTEAVKENTDATQAQTDVLSPFYSTDTRNMRLGFRAFAGGGIMTSMGELPLRQYAGGGTATSPQVAVFGEGSTPEAYVPVPSGRIPVEIKQPANSNKPVVVNIHIQGNADAGTVQALKSTAFQQAQAMRRVMA